MKNKVDVRTEIIISCTLEKLSEYTSDPDNAPNWYVNIKSVEWKTPKPLQINSKIAFKAEFLGKALSYVYEIVEYLPGEKLVMRTSDGPFPMETTYTWQSLPNAQTKMCLRNAGMPTGFSKWMSPFIKWAMRKANLNDLKLLKKIMERNQES